MGMFFSRFKKKRTAFQELEQIEKKIASIKNFQNVTEHRQKKIVGYLCLYSVSFYIITSLICYFYFFPKSFRDRLIYAIPLSTFPVVVILVKKLVTWYYRRQITYNEEKLSDLKAEKKQMLDNVMDKETYKVAKEILEKFAPEMLRLYTSPVPAVNSKIPALPDVEVRRRLKPELKDPFSYQRPLQVQSISGNNASNGGNIFQRPQLPQLPQLPRPILPKERSSMDKLVEFIIGDGPNNRYALICKNCSSHNGMALKEEFIFIAFKCCYCGFWNPARQQRPQAPRLEDSRSTEMIAIKAAPAAESESETDEEVKDSEGMLENEDENLKGNIDSDENSDGWINRVEDTDEDEVNDKEALKNKDEGMKVDDKSGNDIESDREDTNAVKSDEAPEKSNTDKKVD